MGYCRDGVWKICDQVVRLPSASYPLPRCISPTAGCHPPPPPCSRRDDLFRTAYPVEPHVPLVMMALNLMYYAVVWAMILFTWYHPGPALALAAAHALLPPARAAALLGGAAARLPAFDWLRDLYGVCYAAAGQPGAFDAAAAARTMEKQVAAHREAGSYPKGAPARALAHSASVGPGRGVDQAAGFDWVKLGAFDSVKPAFQSVKPAAVALLAGQEGGALKADNMDASSNSSQDPEQEDRSGISGSCTPESWSSDAEASSDGVNFPLMTADSAIDVQGLRPAPARGGGGRGSGSAKRPFIFGYHPQGYLARGAVHTFAAVGRGSPVAGLPGVKLAVGSGLLRVPLLQQVLLLIGCTEASYDNLRALLTSDQVGGVQGLGVQGFGGLGVGFI